MTAHTARPLSLLVLLSLLAGCGSGGPAAVAGTSGYTLAVTPGRLNAGAGWTSLALLATVRDEDGQGPDTPWQLTLEAPTGERYHLSYDDSSVGSYQLWWFDEVPATPGEYRLWARAEAEELELSFRLEEAPGLETPAVAFADSALRWAPVPEARSYACTLTDGWGGRAMVGPHADPRCPLSLPEGAWTAEIRAFSVDLQALAEDESELPGLPSEFDAAETRFGLTLGTALTQIRAAGGRLDYGAFTGGLAVWVDVETLEGADSTEPWTVTVDGPGMAWSQPLQFTYGGGAAVTWAYDLEPVAGLYAVVAERGVDRLATTFHLGELSGLPLPDPTVTPSGSGGAVVNWPAVEGAARYEVSAWSADGGAEPSALVRTTETEHRFAPGTFVADQAYDIYVAAISVDVTAPDAPVPDPLLVSENAYVPARLVAQ